MGCGSWTNKCDNDEKPVHEVCLDGFYMGKYEVTQGQWLKVEENNPSYFRECGSDCPVEGVSWREVRDFIEKLNVMSQAAYRLPTEAEWEFTARSGGKPEKYAGDNDADQVAWYSGNSDGRSHQVGTRAPNGLGLYDLSGNVWEWCMDWYDSDYYDNSPRYNPRGPSSGSSRVFRGGSWYRKSEWARTTNRYWSKPGNSFSNLGFRLVLPRDR